MKLNLAIYQISTLFLCSFQTSECLLKPGRRFFENLGRIHDAIHELQGSEHIIGDERLDRPLDTPVQRPFRNRQDRLG